ncbi:hypothetical protein FB461_1557 [Rarobacter faecitabidus]|uniref:Uncharacterized protein n=1 Tax=Rarobacter faecitabidus TaxID=13243 RepID=A0A542ZXE1_RARFA|nr:hypothetical protein FB461_1557 [Rarobacter faecitabidus]
MLRELFSREEFDRRSAFWRISAAVVAGLIAGAILSQIAYGSPLGWYSLFLPVVFGIAETVRLVRAKRRARQA